MATLTGTGLANFGQSKKGTPYVYGAKGAHGKLTQTRVNNLAAAYPNVFTSNYLKKIANKGLVGKVCCDCSGLISWYTKKELGSAQLYSQAYARLPISQWEKFAVGTVLWKSGHVSIYLGNGLVAEERGIDYGCIISKITDVKWKYGLTFSWMNYEIETPVASDTITYKGTNPYKTPTRTLKLGMTGDDVKWLQWELREAGYTTVAIDGDFGTKTESALKKFQSSAKITVDGKCGPATRTALTKEVNPYSEPTRTIKKGMSGEGVRWLQWELKQAGYNITIDGNFGDKTEEALIAFQKKHKLEQDAQCGPVTRTALKAA